MTTSPRPAATPLRMFYLDDSGSADTGYIVFSWIESTPDDWRQGLRSWLDMRKALYAEHSIPVSYELHASKFAGGRGRPSTEDSINTSKLARHDVMELALATIASSPGLRVGTVYRRVSVRGRRFQQQKHATYSAFIDRLERRLDADGELALI